jgi:CspA family cold shock protein
MERDHEQQFKEGDLQRMSDRTQGIVKWFSRAKGYGFIQPDGATDDVFVHYSVIAGDGFRNLQRGERVEFGIEDTPKGPQAIEVTQLGFEQSEEEEEAVPESEAFIPNIDL